MTIEEFKTLMAEYLSEGYYTSKFSGEEIDALLEWVKAQKEKAGE